MHELGVVFHCIKEINAIAAENGIDKISSVTIQIGEDCTVIPHYFKDFSRWAVKKETVLRDADLVVEKIDAVTHCNDCGKNYPTVEHGKKCPHCGGDATFLVTGNEIMIKEIQVPDE